MEKILGLDLGTNSIGWAIVQRDNRVTTLLDRGVLIFEEGVKIEKGIESSRAAERTDHRALRRHYFRRRIRKVQTLKALSDLGFCPKLTKEQLYGWQTNGEYPLTDEFIMWQRTDDAKGKNPYRYRFMAIDRRLNLDLLSERYILGRALYHIAQRRGFLSNRLETTKESEESEASKKSEGNKVQRDIDTLSEQMAQTGSRTLGEFFYKCYGNEKIRNKYTSRLEHYKAEFDEICRVQQLLPEDVRKIERAIFFQRPLRSQKGLVGKCTFEPKKARCPISHPRFERYRMLCFVNNIRMKGPEDAELRPLTQQEKLSIEPLFLRKSKDTFNFEDIAKALAGKNNYAHVKEPKGKPYLFNYSMNTSVSGSPFTADIRGLLGDNWQQELFDRYTLRKNKSIEQVVNDIWHVLFSFNSHECLADFATQKLVMNPEEALKFSKFKRRPDYAALSLKAINKIIPYLEKGLIYSHAVFLANMASVVEGEDWEKYGQEIEHGIGQVIDSYAQYRSEVLDYNKDMPASAQRDLKTMEEKIFEFLLKCGCALRENYQKHLYHPSMMETYPQSTTGLLGSPRTESVRNPMAMRALFQLRRLINKLIVEGKITVDTKINVELARELNNANMRKAIEQWQREKEAENKKYVTEIRTELGSTDFEPSQDEILKYRWWLEQDKKCLYTGNSIGVVDFIGNATPKFDIEHTIARSIGGDNSQMNRTLADLDYNRNIKKTKLPSELAEFEAIKVRIEPWLTKIKDLEKLIQSNKRRVSFASKEDKDKHITRRNRLKIELDYWRGKYERMVTVDLEHGFRNSQGVDAGIISKYARLYLKSVFPKVYSVKGSMTAEFRKLWGLQSDFEKKERVNHVHHCIDAITIACIGKYDMDIMGEYYRKQEAFEWGRGARPTFVKPWETFAEDVKAIEQELLISHYTPDNMGKNTKKVKRVRGKICRDKNGKIEYLQGDTARCPLHQETYYGAISKDNEIKYVVRKPLGSLEESNIKDIVDEVVRQKVQGAIDELGFKQAMASQIWMNKEKGIDIKKVRCYMDSVKNPLHIRYHRDQSHLKYKRQYHVVNNGNYLMAIYEGEDEKGKLKRDFKLLNNLKAISILKRNTDDLFSSDVVPLSKEDLPLRCTLKIGTKVILWENSPQEIWELDKAQITKRLYKITGMSTLTVQSKYSYGTLTLKHHQEARASTDLKAKSGVFISDEQYRPVISLLHSQFNALVEGYDFELNVLGEIIPLK